MPGIPAKCFESVVIIATIVNKIAYFREKSLIFLEHYNVISFNTGTNPAAL